MTRPRLAPPPPFSLRRRFPAASPARRAREGPVCAGWSPARPGGAPAAAAAPGPGWHKRAPGAAFRRRFLRLRALPPRFSRFRNAIVGRKLDLLILDPLPPRGSRRPGAGSPAARAGEGSAGSTGPHSAGHERPLHRPSGERRGTALPASREGPGAGATSSLRPRSRSDPGLSSDTLLSSAHDGRDAVSALLKPPLRYWGGFSAVDSSCSRRGLFQRLTGGSPKEGVFNIEYTVKIAH